MIQAVVMYQCICDNCKNQIKFGDGWSTFHEDDLQTWIENEEYSMQIIDGKHICDDCIVQNEEGENIIDTTKTI